MKSAIKTNQSQTIGNLEGNWKSLWKLKLHERFKVLVWRIANGILPTRTVVASKLGQGDVCCPFCHDSEESIDHLFFKCSVSRAIWFGLTWAIHSCHFNILNSKDILKFICDPPIIATANAEPKSLREQTSIQFATTLECIWNLRNQVVHHNHEFNIMVIIKQLAVRILEHIHAVEEPKAGVESNVKRLDLIWKVPAVGTIKLNFDATCSMDIAAISVVARNNHGHIIKAWAKLIAAKDPAVAEASAINWAMEQAECENYKSISVESDSKLCIDALSSPIAECLWKIHAQTSLSLDLASHFNLCTFLWARRDANQVAHVLAKVALSLCHPLCCNSVSLPPSALEAWTRDLSLLSN